MYKNRLKIGKIKNWDLSTSDRRSDYINGFELKIDKIVDKSYRLSNGHWSWKIQQYIDQTNIKLCY